MKNKLKTFTLIVLTLIISGCGSSDVFEAKAKAWGELQCKTHEGLYKVEVSFTTEGIGYCNDGTFIREYLSDFTHPIVKKYLKKEEDINSEK